MVGDNAGVVKPEHFKPHCRTTPNGDQAPQQFALQHVMIRVVMALAEKDKVSASQTSDKSLAIDELLGGDVPNTSGERMILT
jgi:hypothetical protein